MDFDEFLERSWDKPEWDRETPRGFWDPPRKLIKSIRDYQSAKPLFGGLSRKIAVLRHRFWSAICGCDIPINCNLGGGLNLPHPVGIVIHPSARIGTNCTLFQHVTITGQCTLAGKVDVGAGATLLDVEIGKFVAIGASAVVTKSVPDYSVAVGIPANNASILKRGSGGGQESATVPASVRPLPMAVMQAQPEKLAAEPQPGPDVTSVARS